MSGRGRSGGLTNAQQLAVASLVSGAGTSLVAPVMPKTLKAVYKYAAQNFGNTIRVYPAQAYVQTTIRNISAVSISYGESNNPNSNGNDPGSFTVLLSGKTAVQPGSLKGVYVKPTTVVATERPLVEIEMEVAL